MMHKDNKQYDQCDLYNIGQLLLKLSNDVEENPGPAINDIVDCSYTIHASFNQGNNLFGLNAGKQCVAMSLSAIVYKEIKSVNIWNRTTLNTIMVCGDNLVEKLLTIPSSVEITFVNHTKIVSSITGQ